MHHSIRHAWAALGFCLLLGGLSGCAQTSWGNPFASKQPEANFDTPSSRVEQLRQIAATQDERPESENVRLANEMAAASQTETDPIVRAELVRTLKSYKTEAAQVTLTAAIKDSEPDVRIAACEGWAERGGPEAVQLLSETLSSDTDMDVRLAAARGLGKLRDPGSMAALGLALEDPNPALQYRAVQSLKNISDQNYGDDVNAWRQFVQGEAPTPKNRSLAQKWRDLF